MLSVMICNLDLIPVLTQQNWWAFALVTISRNTTAENKMTDDIILVQTLKNLSLLKKLVLVILVQFRGVVGQLTLRKNPP